ANEQLADKIHHFTRSLMRAPTRRAVLAQMELAFREVFDVSQTVLRLFGSVGANTSALRFVRQVAPSDPNLAGFETLLASGKPRCGQIRDTQRDFIFGADSGNVGSVALGALAGGAPTQRASPRGAAGGTGGSVALVPLPGDAPLGLLVLGSPSRDRFHPGMSTDF